MKKTIFIYVFVLLFLCGCDVSYNVVVKENFSVEENATVTETEDYFNDVSSKDESIKLIYSPYEGRVLTANYYVIDYRKGYDSGKYLSNSFSNIADFVTRSIFYKQFWPGLTYVENNNLITIKTVGDFIVPIEYSYDYAYVDNCEVTLTLPYKVTDSTANSCVIDKNNYVCKWNINSNIKNLVFSLTLDKDIKVSDMPNTNNNGIYNPIPYNNIFSNVLIIVGLILLIVGLIVIIVLIVHYKEKKDLEKQERGH